MLVLVESAGPQSSKMRRRAVRRTYLAMRHLSWLVPRASVQLGEVSDRGEGVYKRCRVELRTDGARPIVVTSLARDWRSAMDNALSRAARSVLRLWIDSRR